MNFNPRQTEAIHSSATRIVVMAGPGTGKTATLVSRTCHLLKNGIRPESIVLLTYTKKAAAEMKERAILTHPNSHRLHMTTFHSFAARFIRKHPAEFGVDSRFSILDEADSLSLLRFSFRSHQIPENLLKPEELLYALSISKNTLQDLTTNFLERFGSSMPLAMKLADEYAKNKTLSRALDYDDLLYLLYTKLKEKPSLAYLLKTLYSHVLVDECQDNNFVQGAILDLWNPSYLMMVGDLSQSIYGFRGASPEILRKALQVPGTHVIRLENSYRSGQDILDYVNGTIQFEPDALELESERKELGRVHVRPFLNIFQEAHAIARWIERCLQNGVPPSQIAVLSRAASTFQTLEQVLTQKGVRYQKWGGITLTERSEFRDLMAILRLGRNPFDRVAWFRILNMVPRIGVQKADKLLGSIFKTSSDLFDGSFCFETLPEPLMFMKDFVGSLQVGHDAYTVIDKILPFFLKLIDGAYKDNLNDRRKRLIAFGRSLRGAGISILDLMDNLEEDDDDQTHHDKVALSTIHSAKGKEWKLVWVMGAGDLQIPHPKADCSLDEERRMLYVALSRAKDCLVISWPGQLRPNCEQPGSRFLPRIESGIAEAA